MSGANTAVARTDTLRTISHYLEKAAPRMNASLPRHLTAERLVRVAITAISKNPRLMECSQESLLLALMEAGQLGLEPNGVMGQAYLVPYWNKKTNSYEAQFQPGYRGLIDLTRRTGEVSKVEAFVVREGDEFSYRRGLNPDLTHVPLLDASAPMTHVYAVAWYTAAGVTPSFDVMTRDQVEAIRKRSKSANDGPWITDYEAMAKKTVVKQLAKWLPLSPEAEAVIEADSRREIGDFIKITPTGLIEDAPELAAPPTRTDSVRAHLASRTIGPGEVASVPAPEEQPTAAEAERDDDARTTSSDWGMKPREREPGEDDDRDDAPAGQLPLGDATPAKGGRKRSAQELGR